MKINRTRTIKLNDRLRVKIDPDREVRLVRVSGRFNLGDRSKTFDALIEGAEKWILLANLYLDGKLPETASTDSDSCGLCDIYFDEDHCSGCPLMESGYVSPRCISGLWQDYNSSSSEKLADACLALAHALLEIASRKEYERNSARRRALYEEYFKSVAIGNK